MTSPLVSTGGCGRTKVRFCFLKSMKTIIYIDGFNLYYRLKDTPYKWLDIQKLSEFYLNLKQHEITKIKYFTAQVKRKLNDSSNVTRQNMYLRVLKTIPNLETIFGQFKKRQVRGVLVDSEDRKQLNKNIVKIQKWEEKKSDVNIASHLVADAYQNKFECAVLLSNDADLTPPLLHIKHKLKKLVIVISPYKKISAQLKKSSHFYKAISPVILKQCQFPEKMKDDKGEFFCPPKWKQNS